MALSNLIPWLAQVAAHAPDAHVVERPETQSTGFRSIVVDVALLAEAREIVLRVDDQTADPAIALTARALHARLAALATDHPDHALEVSWSEPGDEWELHVPVTGAGLVGSAFLIITTWHRPDHLA